MGDHLGTPGAAGMGSDSLLRRIWMVSNPACSTDGSGLWSCACDHIRSPSNMTNTSVKLIIYCEFTIYHLWCSVRLIDGQSSIAIEVLIEKDILIVSLKIIRVATYKTWLGSIFQPKKKFRQVQTWAARARGPRTANPDRTEAWATPSPTSSSTPSTSVLLPVPALEVGQRQELEESLQVLLKNRRRQVEEADGAQRRHLGRDPEPAILASTHRQDGPDVAVDEKNRRGLDFRRQDLGATSQDGVFRRQRRRRWRRLQQKLRCRQKMIFFAAAFLRLVLDFAKSYLILKIETFGCLSQNLV